jgi:hypothetical protein
MAQPDRNIPRLTHRAHVSVKDWIGITICLLISGVIGLLILAAATAPPTTRATASPPVAAMVAATDEEDEIIEEIEAVAEAEPVPPATVPAEPEPEPPLPDGLILTPSGLGIRAQLVDYVPQLGPYTKPTPGYHFAVYLVMVHNEGRRSQFVSPTQFTLVDEGGLTYGVASATYTYGANALPGVSIQPFAFTGGAVVFEIDTRRTPSHLIYRGSSYPFTETRIPLT